MQGTLLQKVGGFGEENNKLPCTFLGMGRIIFRGAGGTTGAQHNNRGRLQNPDHRHSLERGRGG